MPIVLVLVLDLLCRIDYEDEDEHEQENGRMTCGRAVPTPYLPAPVLTF